MILSIVIPCYNEKATVQKLLTRVTSAPFPAEVQSVEIIAVDDFSTDGTRDILQSVMNDPTAIGLRPNQKFELVCQTINGGKGKALRTGFAKAKGDVILVQDADLEYDPDDYPALLKPILKGYADVVFGSRFIGQERRVLYFVHFLANKFVTFLSNLLTNLNITDMETGYKVFRADIIKNLNLESDRFGFEPEVTAKVAKLKARIFEVGVSYQGRTYEEGKKITWKDGAAAIWHIIRFNLFP